MKKEGYHQAIVRHKTGVKIAYVKTPRLNDGELLLAPLVVGLCGTDIQMLRGERYDPAKIIGHEGICEIVATGAGCPNYLFPGKRVFINPTHPNHLDCLLGHNMDGLLQEYIHIPKRMISDGLIVPVSHQFPLILAGLIEPLAAVLYAFDLMKPSHRNGSLMIYGDGITGHLALLYLKINYGESLPTIFVHHTHEGRRWSQQNGIYANIDLVFDESHYRSLNTKSFPEPTAILLATPRLSTLACLFQAIKHVAPNGVIDLLGGVPEKVFLSDIPHVDLAALRQMNCAGTPVPGKVVPVITVDNKPIFLSGHRGVSKNHLLCAMSELMIHQNFYKKLITHELPMKCAAEFMNQLFKKSDRMIRNERVIKLNISVNSQQKDCLKKVVNG